MTGPNPMSTLGVTMSCKGVSSGKMRNELEVSGNWDHGDPWTLATDEGAFHGGEDSAPPPLALFAAGLTGCFMTQVRAFAKKMRVSVEHISVEAEFEWQAEMHANEPYVASPVGFTLDIEIDSQSSLENLRELIDAAKKGCFLEQTLVRANAIKHRLKVGSGWIDV